ncbi:MAG: glycoside hydrolase family 9 protein [Bacteroidota bacterium]
MPVNRLSFYLLLWILSLFPNWLQASTVTEVTPLTDKIILLYVEDGFVELSGRGENLELDSAFKDVMDVSAAMLSSNYSLNSPDDANYATALSPVNVGRKSKTIAQTWDTEGHVFGHWLYLILPSPMQAGKSYNLSLTNLNTDVSNVSFTFDPFAIRSEAVHVNQVGYLPDARMKYGYLAEWMGDLGPLVLTDYLGNAFHLVDSASGSIVFSGNIALRRDTASVAKDEGSNKFGPYNSLYGSEVAEADFSAFNIPGTYYLAVEGIGRSFPFRIAENVYREPFQKVTKFLYLERAGIAKTAPYADFLVSRDHHPGDGNTVYKSSVRSVDPYDRSTIETNETGPAPNKWGWYHDAGDWDGYITHFRVPLLLAIAYSTAPFSYSDGELNIPESGNGVADILDEAGWLIRYFRRDINPDGSVYGARVAADGDPIGKPPAGNSADDTRKWYALAADPHTNFLFAATVANYAFALEKAGITDSTATLLAEASAAYNWADNPANQQNGDADIGAGFGIKLNDLKLFAAASLYKLTGDATWQTAFESVLQITSPTQSLTGTDFDQTWGVWMYTTAPDFPNTNQSLKTLLTQASYRYAQDIFLTPAKSRTGRVGYNWYLPPIIGATTTPFILEPFFAYQALDNIEQKAELLDYMQTTVDYFLGNNPLNTAWITGIGERHPQQILHLDSWYNESGIKGQIVDGIVPYGPIGNGDWFNGDSANWMTDADWNKIRAYPDRAEWPVSEFWFDNRYSPPDAEFTVHQNSAVATLALGFLGANSNEINQLPLISITAPNDGDTVLQGTPITFTVNASDDQTVARVAYYISGNLIGESFSAPFSLALDSLPALFGDLTVKAYAIDNLGSVSAQPGKIDIYQSNQFGTLPFNNTPAPIPGNWPVHNFDVGANGFAYFDKSNGNLASPPANERSDTDVDLIMQFNQYPEINANDVYLDKTENGEWLTYTVFVEKDTFYDLDLILINGQSGREMSLILDNSDTLLLRAPLPQTGWWPHERQRYASCLFLTRGVHVMKFVFDLVHGSTRISDMIATESRRVSSVAIDQDNSVSAQTGKTTNLSATVLPADASCPGVIWTSLNPAIATIDQQGVLTGQDVGMVSIVVETEDLAKKDTLTLFVKPPVEITDPIANTTFSPGDPTTITATITPTPGYTVDEVAFFLNGDSIGVALTEPYQLSLNVPAGTHLIRAKARFVQGIEAEDEIQIYARAPFTSDLNPHPLPGIINFADYDHGGNGVSYADNSPGNSTGAYRNDDVDINSGGTEVTDLEVGEWLEYTVVVSQAKQYDLNLTYTMGCCAANAQIRFDIDGTAGAVLNLPQFGWWPPQTLNFSDYQTLTAGTHTIRVNVLNVPLNLYSFELTFPGAELKETLPLTSEIIMLRLDDGRVDLHGYGEARSQDKFVGQRLDGNIADERNNYSITSLDDANYATAQLPVSVSRKSKRTEQGDNPATHADEHWIYLQLPFAMQSGKTYQVNLNEVAANTTQTSLTFDPLDNRSEAVHVNQIGYVPSAGQKFGYVAEWMGSGGSADFSSYNGANFYLIDSASGATVFTGNLQLRRALSDPTEDNGNMSRYGPFNNYYGSDVYEADFSSFVSPGTYYLAVEGIGRSFTFDISDDIYEPVFASVSKFFYIERAGQSLTQPYTDFIRKRDHHPGDGNVIYKTSVRSIDDYDRAAVEAGEIGPTTTYG